MLMSDVLMISLCLKHSVFILSTRLLFCDCFFLFVAFLFVILYLFDSS